MFKKTILCSCSHCNQDFGKKAYQKVLRLNFSGSDYAGRGRSTISKMQRVGSDLWVIRKQASNKQITDLTIDELLKQLRGLQKDAEILRRVYPQHAQDIHFVAPAKMLIDEHFSQEELASYAQNAFLEMPYFKGIDARAYLKKYCNDPVRSFNFFKVVFAELNRIHSVGVIHRDIDFSNILVEEDSNGILKAVRFIDFEQSTFQKSELQQNIITQQNDARFLLLRIMHQYCETSLLDGAEVKLEPTISEIYKEHFQSLYNSANSNRQQNPSSDYLPYTDIALKFKAIEGPLLEHHKQRQQAWQAKLNQEATKNIPDGITSLFGEYSQRCLSFFGFFTSKHTHNKRQGAEKLRSLVYYTSEKFKEQVEFTESQYRATFEDRCFSLMAIIRWCDRPRSRLACFAHLLIDQKLISSPEYNPETKRYTVARAH